MRAPAFVVFLMILSLPLGACGQKGPLYMPEEPAEESTQ